MLDTTKPPVPFPTVNVDRANHWASWLNERGDWRYLPRPPSDVYPQLCVEMECGIRFLSSWNEVQADFPLSRLAGEANKSAKKAIVSVAIDALLGDLEREFARPIAVKDVCTIDAHVSLLGVASSLAATWHRTAPGGQSRSYAILFAENSEIPRASQRASKSVFQLLEHATLQLASVPLNATQAKRLASGDIVMLERGNEAVLLLRNARAVVSARLLIKRTEIKLSINADPTPFSLSDERAAGSSLNARFSFSGISLPISDLATLAPGAVVDINRDIDELEFEVRLNEQVIGKGRLVQFGDRLGMQMLEVNRA
jgi:hypothetical protein